MYDNFIYFGKGIGNGDRCIIILEGSLFFLKMGTKAVCFQRVGKICCYKLRLNIYRVTDGSRTVFKQKSTR